MFNSKDVFFYLLRYLDSYFASAPRLSTSAKVAAIRNFLV